MRRLIEGGAYSRAALIRVITVCMKDNFGSFRHIRVTPRGIRDNRSLVSRLQSRKDLNSGEFVRDISGAVMYGAGLSMWANSFTESSCFGYVGVSVFSCAVIGVVQMDSPLVAEGRLHY